MERGDRALDVVDQVQRLRHDDAVEGCVGDLRSLSEVSDDRGGWIAVVDVKHVPSCRTLPAETAGVLVVSDLESPAGDVTSISLQEALDVVPVDRQAAVVPELSADGPKPSQVAPVPHARFGRGCSTGLRHGALAGQGRRGDPEEAASRAQRVRARGRRGGGDTDVWRGQGRRRVGATEAYPVGRCSARASRGTSPGRRSGATGDTDPPVLPAGSKNFHVGGSARRGRRRPGSDSAAQASRSASDPRTDPAAIRRSRQAAGAPRAAP